jgi:predicted nucleic-acid-binding Zn-ribbon protein
MTSRRLFIGKILTLAIVAPLICVAKDKSVAKEEKKETKASVPKLVVTGATLVECGEKKTKIAIKCTKCGYKATLEIDTPTADQPYTQEWKCPKCGNKQTIKVEVAKAE